MPRKTKTTTVDEPVTTTTTEVANDVVETPVVQDTLSDAFGELLTQLSAMRTQITALSTQVKSLKKRSEREIRTALKENRKRKNTNRKPSGFVKPTPISSELATFLGKDPGVEMARTQVTREINEYIKEHNLKKPTNGRVILADAKLRKLLRLKKDDELTFFNLQKYMKHHFPKSAKAVAAESV
tara:strand:- start:28742 stop:29293 length:552 start_codon:yes stop_codon:yes gene_type:complete